jgi:predicted nucleic acid-binding Zn ribbon protein
VRAVSDWLRRILGGGPAREPSDLGTVIEGVTPHSHCERCGKAITLGKRFCSESCKRGEGRGGMSSLFWMFLLLMLLMLMLGR